MRDPGDALRSVRRYMAEFLGDDWEVRNWVDEGANVPQLARIAQSGPTLYQSQRTQTNITMPLQMHLYPAVAPDASSAHRQASAIEAMIINAIEVGVGLAFPRRIPLYDYEGVLSTETSNKRQTYDFLRVLDLSVNSIPDSDVPTAVVVVADLRVAWSRDTTINPGYPTVESVRVTQRAS